MLQQIQGRVPTTVKQLVLTSKAWLAFELSRCETSHPALYGRFDEPKLGTAHDRRDYSINTHQGMLKGGGVVVVNGLTIVTGRYEACLMSPR